MTVQHFGAAGLRQETAALRRDERRAGRQTIQNAAIGNAGIRVYDGGWIRIEDGGLQVTGTASVSGRLEGDGTLEWDGPSYFNGTTTVRGNFGTTGSATIAGSTTISGNTTISGDLNVTGETALNADVTLNQDLTLGPSGKITAGTVVIDRAGSYGGRVVSTGSILYLYASSSVVIGADYLSTNKIEGTDAKFFTLDVLGAKSFRMPHPTKPGQWLRHGSTESPVSGIEYWGESTIGADGSIDVELPEYFEALAKPGNRTVFVTGRGHSPDWSDIDDGSFTVTGSPGGRFSWLVKAERFGGDFLLEEEVVEGGR